MTSLQSTRWINKALTLVLLGALATACAGGSGSSGFDAKLAERAAILQALAQDRCVTPPTRKPVYCPADVAVPVGGLGSILVGVDQAQVPCSAAGQAQCTVSLPFMPEGLPPSVTYRIAIRTLEPLEAWRISAVGASNNPGAPDFDGTGSVDLPAPTSSTPAPSSSVKAQIAILVYLSPPPAVPLPVETLAASGADFAYVSNDLNLQITP